MTVTPAEILVALVTAPSANADVLAHTLVSERLAACVNVVDGIQSTYRWQGSVERAAETLLVIKTTRERYPALEARIREIHPYECPEIIASSLAEGFGGYLEWVAAQCAEDGGAE